MKALFVALVILAPQLVKAQTTMTNKECFEFSGVCYKEVIISTADCNFILKLRNNSDSVLKVPVNYFESSLFSTNINFGYEVFWCKGKDTTDLTATYQELNQVPYYSLHKSRLLHPDEDLLLELAIYPFFFRKKGTYKIRFIYKAGIYNEGFQDVSTHWMFLTVKEPLAGDK